MVSDTGRTILRMNDAAALKAGFFDHMLHDVIVRMRVDAHIVDLSFTVSERSREDAVCPFGGSDAMERSIGTFIEPGTVFDVLIGRIFSEDKSKDTADCALFTQQVQLTRLDVV